MVDTRPLEGARPPRELRIAARSGGQFRAPPSTAWSAKRWRRRARRSLVEIVDLALDLAQSCRHWPSARPCRGPHPAAPATYRASHQTFAAAKWAPRSVPRSRWRAPADWRPGCRYPPSKHSGEQRLERTGVVPVEEVAAIALHATRVSNVFCVRSSNLRGGAIAEIVGRQVRQAAPCRCSSGWCAAQRPGRILLDIVRRQPVLFGA